MFLQEPPSHPPIFPNTPLLTESSSSGLHPSGGPRCVRMVKPTPALGLDIILAIFAYLVLPAPASVLNDLSDESIHSVLHTPSQHTRIPNVPYPTVYIFLSLLCLLTYNSPIECMYYLLSAFRPAFRRNTGS